MTAYSISLKSLSNQFLNFCKSAGQKYFPRSAKVLPSLLCLPIPHHFSPLFSENNSHWGGTKFSARRLASYHFDFMNTLPCVSSSVWTVRINVEQPCCAAVASFLCRAPSPMFILCRSFEFGFYILWQRRGEREHSRWWFNRVGGFYCLTPPSNHFLLFFITLAATKTYTFHFFSPTTIIPAHFGLVFTL